MPDTRAAGGRDNSSRADRVILYADLVESVRLIEQDEEGTLRAWLSLMDEVRERILPEAGGRLIKGLGDGFIAEFMEPRSAVAASFAIHKMFERTNSELPPERRIHLRAGIDRGNVIITDDDRFGHVVNVACRLGDIALPGGTVISVQARDGLVDAIDCDVEDLGECWLKHVETPVRAYRVVPSGTSPHTVHALPSRYLRPTIAVMPFTPLVTDPESLQFGEVIADAVINLLSLSTQFDVISRLSTSALARRMMTTAEIGEHLNADYVLDGTCRVEDGGVSITAQISEAPTGRVVWTERFRESLGAVLQDEQEVVRNIVSAALSAIVAAELKNTRRMPLLNLPGYTLLLSAIALMHRLTQDDYTESRGLLEALIERAPRCADAHAWLANWHVLRVIQGWSSDITADARHALEHSARALDADPESGRALAVDGFVQLHLRKRFDLAAERFDRAVESNPNESIAWLMRGTMYAFSDRGAEAVENTERAGRLSPLDPHRYFTDSLRASAYLTAGDLKQALSFAERSKRANRSHASTLRVLAVAQHESGQTEAARETVAELLKLEPKLTISQYLKRAPSAAFDVGGRVAAALKAAGVPA